MIRLAVSGHSTAKRVRFPTREIRLAVTMADRKGRPRPQVVMARPGDLAVVDGVAAVLGAVVVSVALAVLAAEALWEIRRRCRQRRTISVRSWNPPSV